jgi:mevalonate kinase
MTAQKTTWQSRASGSLMLFGEHSVLHGHPAIACAVDRWLSIRWQVREDPRIVIRSAVADHETDWQTLLPHPALTFVMASLAWLKNQLADNLVGLDIEIVSDIDHTQGLGSSSAVVAAMVLGFEPLLGQRSVSERFAAGLSIIHAVQGRGSGTDLAATLVGGVMMLEPTTQRITRLADYLPIVSVYCGYKTPTPVVIAQVDRAWQAYPEVFQQQLAWMRSITQQAAQAIASEDWTLLGRLMVVAHGLLQGLGVSDAQLDRLMHQLLNTDGMLGAKISGSGLGDCVIGLGTPVVAIESALRVEVTDRSADVK